MNKIYIKGFSSHNKNNLHDYEQGESWTESIFTGLLMLGAVAVIVLIAALSLHGAN